MTLVIRGTAAFRKRVPDRSPAGGEALGALGEWFANVRLWRPHLAIFVHRETYLPVLVDLAPASTVIVRFAEQMERVLLELGVPADAVDRHRVDPTDARVEPTKDRSVVGVMNEYVKMLDWWRHDAGPITGDTAVRFSVELAQTPVRAGSPSATWPDEAVHRLLAG